MQMSYERRGSSGGFGGGNRFGPKPVEEGKEYDVDIKEISRRGEGIKVDVPENVRRPFRDDC